MSQPLPASNFSPVDSSPPAFTELKSLALLWGRPWFRGGGLGWGRPWFRGGGLAWSFLHVSDKGLFILVMSDITGAALLFPPECLFCSLCGEGPSVHPILALDLASSPGSIIPPVTGSKAGLG